MLVELSTRKTISARTASLQAAKERTKGIVSVGLDIKCLEPMKPNDIQKGRAMPGNLYSVVLEHHKRQNAQKSDNNPAPFLPSAPSSSETSVQLY